MPSEGNAKVDKSPFVMDGDRTALVLHDLQNRNLQYPYVPNSFDTIARNGSHLARNLREAGGLAIYTHVLEAELLRLPADVTAPESGPPAPGSEDLATVAGFQAGDVLVTKRQLGAFYGTDLELHLRRRDIKTLIIAGVATELAVESTARAAYDHGFALVFARDAIGGRAEASHHFFLEQMFPMIGRVASVDDIIVALSTDAGIRQQGQSKSKS